MKQEKRQPCEHKKLYIQLRRVDIHDDVLKATK